MWHSYNSAVILLPALLALSGAMRSSGAQEDGQAILHRWAEAQGVKWPTGLTFKVDPATSAWRAATKDGNDLVGLCWTELPQVTDQAQKAAVERAYGERARLTATVAAGSLLVQPTIERWDVEEGEFSERLAAFVVQKRLVVALPPDTVMHVGIADKIVCAYVRIPKSTKVIRQSIAELKKDAMLKDFSAWIAEQGVSSTSRGAFREALRLFAIARKADAHNTVYLSHALYCFASLRQTEDFEAIVHSLLRNKRYPARVYIECGQVCSKLGKLEKAIQLYRQVADDSPQRAVADVAMACAYVAIQQRALDAHTSAVPSTATSRPHQAKELSP